MRNLAGQSAKISFGKVAHSHDDSRFIQLAAVPIRSQKDADSESSRKASSSGAMKNTLTAASDMTKATGGSSHAIESARLSGSPAAGAVGLPHEVVTAQLCETPLRKAAHGHPAPSTHLDLHHSSDRLPSLNEL